MTDLNEAHEPNVPLPSKRKLTTASAAAEIDTAKKLRPETTPAAAAEEKIINGEKTETENDDEDSEEYEAEDEVGSDDAVSDDDDSDGEEEENTNGKGKGKMIEESDDDDDDDDDDDSDDGSATDSDGDDDLSDDPLAEVDLDNILPSRTRGRSAANSGVRISSNAADGDDKNDK